MQRPILRYHANLAENNDNQNANLSSGQDNIIDQNDNLTLVNVRHK